MNVNQPPSLLRNANAAPHHWFQARLTGTTSNRSAIGAKVRVEAAGRSQTTVILSQSGYYSVNDPRAHFGLGPASKVDLLEITWPNGNVESWRNLAADQLFQATEGAAPQ